MMGKSSPLAGLGTAAWTADLMRAEADAPAARVVVRNLRLEMESMSVRNLRKKFQPRQTIVDSPCGVEGFKWADQQFGQIDAGGSGPID
jgi:hypothetical protein